MPCTIRKLTNGVHALADATTKRVVSTQNNPTNEGADPETGIFGDVRCQATDKIELVKSKKQFTNFIRNFFFSDIL